jgi:hypothetical protein
MTRTTIPLLAAGVVAAAWLTSCAADDAGPATPPPFTAPAPVPASAPSIDVAPVSGCTGQPISAVPPVEVSARLLQGRVTPAPWRVDVALGAPVVLRIEADTPTEVHVHGFDRLAEAAPGAPACLEFVADVPGVFEVEAHPHTLLLQLAVR